MNQAEHLTTTPLPHVRSPRRPRPPMGTVVALVIGALVLGAVGYRLLAGDGGTVRTDELSAGTPTTTATDGPATTTATDGPATDGPATTTAGPATTAQPRVTTAPPATTATTRPEPEPERLTSASRLRLDGIGPITVGMTLGEASAVSGVILRLHDMPSGPECRYAGADERSGLADELAFMVYGDRIVRVDVVGRGDRIRTVSGIGKGSTEADVWATYPGRIRSEPHPYAEGGKILIYMPQDGSSRHLTMIFEVIDGRVMNFRSGFLEPVFAPEGCS